MPHHWFSLISQYSSVIGFLIALPFMIGAYYESFRARRELRRASEGTLHSANCLEFIAGDGTCINLVPLETLHSLPREGDVLLLPGDGVGAASVFLPGAYLVESIEHIYTPAEGKGMRPNEARLTKAVARVTSLNPQIVADATAEA
ncbi:MAG: hypothetical protein ABSE36_15940 [Terracidiphilus sp.]|jgi:hypothetical protein